MDRIAHTTGLLCMTVFVMGILYEFCSFEKTAKAVKYIICLCILVSVFKTVSNVNLNIHLPYTYLYDNKTYTEYFIGDVITQTQKELETLISERLKEQNISYNQLSLHILEENGVLKVDEITVRCNPDSKQVVYDCIKDIISQDTIVNILE